MINTLSLPEVPRPGRGAAMSGYLLGWTVFTACVWVASPQVNRAVNLLFLVLVAVFGLLAIGEGPTAKPSSESARPAESSTRSSA